MRSWPYTHNSGDMAAEHYTTSQVREHISAQGGQRCTSTLAAKCYHMAQTE
jgi:hypothetical protein